MTNARVSLKSMALGSCAFGALLAAAAPAAAEQFSVSAQDLRPALQQFASQGDQQVLFSSAAVAGKQTSGFTGEAAPETALQQLLSGTDLVWSKTGDGALLVMTKAEAQAGRRPQLSSAEGDGAEGGSGSVEALIVTAQKREEDIQDVPIAISAFTQEDLTRSQVAGGPDLMTQVPNMTFTKTNFSSYSVQLRGIGTQAISATTDPAVAVAFNNTPFIRNRFFEQEFYDLQRIEVLRGPQGTLYGRNATAGVVNIISAKPKFAYEAKVSADVSNYSSSRLEAMVNVPLVDDVVALRVAGAWTKRDGYATNEISGNPIDGRDLWSTRMSLRFAPTDALDVNLIWEHFQENDDRLRSGKQLCKKDVVTHFGNYQVTNNEDALPDHGQAGAISTTMQSAFSQGCARESLYSPDSFQTPQGQSIPYYFQLGAIGLPRARLDPYVSQVQSRDLRVIESTIDPDYRAKADLGELQVSFDLTDELTLSSETAYSRDFVWSMQDFNRFNTSPDAWINPPVGTHGAGGALDHGPTGGIFCDPQLGCSDRLMAVDISTARASQFSQELRLASDFEGPFNFSLGGNFLRADSEDKYYVFINSLSLISALAARLTNMPPYVVGQSDNMECLKQGRSPGDFTQAYPVTGCTYIDPNPIGAVNDQGHNYFLSKNPYKLISYAVFGEAYYNITDNLKLTAGLRLTDDKKEAPRIPTWILASFSYGYPVAEAIRQEWREPTGRLALDWKPDLAFTDETLLYASYAHGYKAGGANPPGFVRVFYADRQTAEANAAKSETRPKVFDPEFVDAFELGSKNTFADGRATLNLAAFYYDYKDYQISEIVDRSAFNRNFDATVWGVELEADWRPIENLRLGLKGGYEKTRIADGEQAIDLMDRTAGTPGWSVVRPFPTYASSCILPTWLYQATGNPGHPFGLGGPNGGNPGGCEYAYGFNYDPVTERPYAPVTSSTPLTGGLSIWLPGTYPGWDPSTAPNHGEGFDKQLGGNELPNAPNWTWTITGDYTVPLANDWLATLHTDLHWQSESWWRVFNDHEYDKLDEYFTMNVAAIFTNEEAGWNVMAYVKNVTDETAITGAFLNSDDTGLTTNVFLTEPRLYGVRITKNFEGGPWWSGANPDHPAGEPYPLTVEISGQVQRQDAPYQAFEPSFASAFPDGLNIFTGAQNRDLDLGDGRQVKVTWRPDDVWSLTAAVRYGRTNSGAVRVGAKAKGEPACAIASPYGDYFCDPQSLGYLYFFVHTPYSWANAEVTSREDHMVVDFAVGREVGLGAAVDRSTVSVGLRYAQFNSTTSTVMDGLPDFHVADGWLYNPYGDYATRYASSSSAVRSFEGFGPQITVAMAKQLIGSEETGHVDLEWSLTGGVLFGKQKASAEAEETSYYWRGKYNDTHISQPADIHATPLTFAPRSQSVTVPVLDLSLGLSYEVQRIKIGAGYRWERYFDAIDGGISTEKSYDRTFDGPYFKLAIGFGG